jgi:hypothetical protein
MSLFNAYVASDSASFPVEDWIKAPTSQPTPVSVGTLSTSAPSDDNSRIEPIDSDRFVVFYRDASGYPTVRIATKSGTPSVGSAVTVVSSSVDNLMLLRRVPNTNYWLLGVNNDLYFINCGASGTTVTSTQISSDAGDAGRAEAFARGITDIVIAEDGTHFVILNEFNNGGTRSFVSALWTLTVGTPAAVYVTRDVDATGAGVAMDQASAYLRGGVAYYVATNGSSLTTCYVNKVTFTVSTVANSINSLTVATFQNSTSLRSTSRNFSRYQTEISGLISHIMQSTANFRVIVIDISSTPSLYTDTSNAGIYNTTPSFAFYASNEFNIGSGVSVSGATAIAHQNLAVDLLSRPLITGLTTYSHYSSCYSNDLNWLIVLGRVNTNDGYVYFLKNAAV